MMQQNDIEITEWNVGLYGYNHVAVKRIQRLSEFKTEGMILRKLQHPNIQMFLDLA